MSFDEVRELLRNTGSMLLHILSNTDWADFSGKTGIEWDAMEVAPLFMTHWYGNHVLSTIFLNDNFVIGCTLLMC